jgi:hypothetical protein
MSSPCLPKSWKSFSNLLVRRVLDLLFHDATLFNPPLFFSLQRSEIAELRQECTELRQANLSLERQVREGIISTVCSQYITARP